MHQTFCCCRRRMDFVCPLNIIDKSSFYDQGFGKGVLLTQPKWLDYQLLTLHYQRSCKIVVINKNFLNCGWVSTAFRNLDKKSFYFRAITHMFNMTLSVFFNDFTALHHRQFCTIENTLHLKNHSIEIHMINQYLKNCNSHGILNNIQIRTIIIRNVCEGLRRLFGFEFMYIRKFLLSLNHTEVFLVW